MYIVAFIFMRWYMSRPFEKIYVKDFDGNILHAPTMYYFEQKQEDNSWKEVEISAHEHDSNPKKYMDSDMYRFINNDKDSTYQNCLDYFHDTRHRWPHTLSEDIKKALDNWDFAPSFPKFKNEVLVRAEIFAILTARQNSPDTLKVNMQYISDNVLTAEEKEEQIENIKKKFGREKDSDVIALKKYFDINCYMPVNNIEVSKFLDMKQGMSSDSKKVVSMQWYINHVANTISQYESIDETVKLKLWFSDDGFANIKSMTDYFASIYDNRYKRGYGEYPYDFFDYKLYYTGNMNQEQLTQEMDVIRKNYPKLSIQEEDKSYHNQQGILNPVTKIIIK